MLNLLLCFKCCRYGRIPRLLALKIIEYRPEIRFKYYNIVGASNAEHCLIGGIAYGNPALIADACDRINNLWRFTDTLVYHDDPVLIKKFIHKLDLEMLLKSYEMHCFDKDFMRAVMMDAIPIDCFDPYTFSITEHLYYTSIPHFSGFLPPKNNQEKKLMFYIKCSIGDDYKSHIKGCRPRFIAGLLFDTGRIGTLSDYVSGNMRLVKYLIDNLNRHLDILTFISLKLSNKTANFHNKAAHRLYIQFLLVADHYDMKTKREYFHKALAAGSLRWLMRKLLNFY